MVFTFFCTILIELYYSDLTATKGYVTEKEHQPFGENGRIKKNKDRRANVIVKCHSQVIDKRHLFLGHGYTKITNDTRCPYLCSHTSLNKITFLWLITLFGIHYSLITYGTYLSMVLT